MKQLCTRCGHPNTLHHEPDALGLTCNYHDSDGPCLCHRVPYHWTDEDLNRTLWDVDVSEDVARIHRLPTVMQVDTAKLRALIQAVQSARGLESRPQR